MQFFGLFLNVISTNMKYQFLIFVTFFSLTTLPAQTLHLHGGLSHSTLDWVYGFSGGAKDKQYFQPVMGYALGLGVEYLDRGLFSLRSDAQFYRSGGQYTAEEISQHSSDSEVLLDYATLTTCLNISPLHGKTKIQVSLGPKVDWLLKGQEQPSMFYPTERAAVSRFNFGIMAGAGLHRSFGKVSVGRARLVAGPRQETGGLSYRKLPRGFGSEAAERVFLFQLSAGYKIK